MLKCIFKGRATELFQSFEFSNKEVQHLSYYAPTSCLIQGGVVLLVCTLSIQTGYNSASKKLSVDIGGAKRLHALSTLVSALLLFPWAMAIYLMREVSLELMVIPTN